MPDYDALAKQFGGTPVQSSIPASTTKVDYDAVAKKFGGRLASTIHPPPSEPPTIGQQLYNTGKSFASETLHNLNPINVAEGAYNIVRHPIDAFNADSQARDAEMAKSVAAFNKGDTLEGATRYLTGAVPVLGPMAGKAFDAINAGNTEEGGKVIADITSLRTVPKAYELPGKLASVVAGKVVHPTAPEMAEHAGAAKELNIPLGVSDYSNARGPRIIENFLANRALGRQPIFDFKQQQNTAAGEAASNIAEGMGEKYTPMEVGSAIRDTLHNQDEQSLQSLIDAEQQRVNRVNLENEAGARGAAKAQNDLTRQRAEAQSDALQNLNNVANSVAPVNSPEASGLAFKQAVNDNANAFRNEARQLYSTVDNLTGGLKAPIDVRPVKAFMANLAEDLQGVVGATAKLKGVDVGRLMDTARTWESVPDFVRFDDGRQISSALKSIGRDYSGLIKNRYAGSINKLSSLLEGQMQDAASQAGPGALEAYQKANDFYKQGVQLFNESSVSKLIQKNPEDIADSVWKPGAITPIRDVQAALQGHPEVWAAIQRRGLEDLFENSQKDGQLNAGKLRANWRALGPQVQDALLGPKKDVFDSQINRLATTQEPFEFEGANQTIKQVQPQAQKLSLTPQQSALRTLASAHPESVADRLLSPNAEALGIELRSALKNSPDLWSAVRRQAFEKLVEGHTKPPVAGGSPVMETKALVRNWRNLGPQVQSLIAGDQLPQINKFMSAVNGLNFEKLPTLHNAIYGGILDPMAAMGGTAAALEAGVHNPIGALTSAGMAATWLLAPKYIAKAMTSPTGIKWLTEGLRIPRGTKAATHWMNQGVKIGVKAGTLQPNRGIVTIPPPPQ